MSSRRRKAQPAGSGLWVGVVVCLFVMARTHATVPVTYVRTEGAEQETAAHTNTQADLTERLISYRRVDGWARRVLSPDRSFVLKTLSKKEYFALSAVLPQCAPAAPPGPMAAADAPRRSLWFVCLPTLANRGVLTGARVLLECSRSQLLRVRDGPAGDASAKVNLKPAIAALCRSQPNRPTECDHSLALPRCGPSQADLSQADRSALRGSPCENRPGTARCFRSTGTAPCSSISSSSPATSTGTTRRRLRIALPSVR